MRNLLLLLAVVISLTACGTMGSLSDKVDASTSRLARVAIADLEAAEQSARLHNDHFAAECWAELRSFAHALRAKGTTDVVGVFTAFQKARNIRRGVQDGWPDIVHARCAHMLRDARYTVIGLGRLVR